MATKRDISNVFVDNADDLYRLKRGKRRKIRMRSSSSGYWPQLNKMDLRLSGIDTDGLSLIGDIGSGGALKQLPALSIARATGDIFGGAGDDLLMLDGAATYEYKLETVFDSFETATDKRIIISNNVGEFGGWMLYMNTAIGFKITVIDTFYGDWDNMEDIDHHLDDCFVLGLNTISVKFNLATKGITTTINGNVYNDTHHRDNIFNKTGDYILLGAGAATKTQKAVTLKMLKNDVPIHEYILGETYVVAGGSLLQVNDLIGNITMYWQEGSPSGTTQDLLNPYKNGYDLYWIEDTLNYQAVSPINSLGTSKNPSTWGNSPQVKDFDLFKRILPTELGYHILNYIEMPDLPIFDTTDRTYWKVSIESDPYYVGGTAGRERWFHKTWLDFDWIDLHIETAYRYLFFAKLKQQKATGQTYIKTKVDDIVLFNEDMSSFHQRRDTYETINLGYFYESLMMRSDSGVNYQIRHTLGNKVVALQGNYLKYSSDAGHTFSAGFNFSAIYPVANIAYLRILNNGNIVIFSNNKLVHYSDDNLVTVVASSVVNADDSPYVFHTPVNPAFPGSYFLLFNGFVETADCIVVSGYTSNGANPMNLYYSIDDGITWKVFYTFGQNPDKRDDGTNLGGSTGNLLGDPANPLIIEIIHGINQGFDGNIYCFAGETHLAIMKCVYNVGGDSWTVTNLLDANSVSWQRMRAIGGYERNGYLYWGANGNVDFTFEGNTYRSAGIWKSLITEINDLTKHVLLCDTLKSCLGGFINHPTTGKVIGVFSNPLPVFGEPREMQLSNDYGETWEKFDNHFDNNLIPVHYNVAGDFWIGYAISKMKYLK